MSPVSAPRNLATLSLYPHQKKAVKCIISYLNGPISKQGKSALIQMPTGSGKTGIIATVSRLCPGINRTLVLAPRVAIKDLLIREIKKDFFDKAGVVVPDREVLELTKERLDKIKTFSNGVVFVATIQQIDTWRRESPAEYKSLQDSFDLVVMDEGHYEPALSWSLSIRELKKPVVLFTATPYRNDLKNFQFDIDAIETLRFADAVQDKFIRNVKIIKRPKPSGVTSFVQDVWAEFKKHLNVQERRSSKLVIRCEDSHDIQSICDQFRRLGIDPIGIHENFNNNPRKPWLVRKVPDPNQTPAQVWVHQNKLLEGVDSAAFRVAAVYKEMGSVRSLVQQIGRIIRNPGQKSGQNAFFFDYQDGAFERMWKSFLEYDKNVTASSLTLSLPVRINDIYNKSLPKLEYFDKSFRKIFDLGSTVDPYAEFRLPKSAYIVEASSNTSVDKISSWVKDTLGDEDIYYRDYPISNGRIFSYIKIQNSKYLTESYFIEPKLGIIIFKKTGNLVSFFDTGGTFPTHESGAGLMGPVGHNKMKKLIKKSDSARILEISTRNSSVANSTIRTRTLSAASLEATAPQFDDFQHFVTAARGYTEVQSAFVRRYLGFSRGHISQDGAAVPLKEYINWVDGLLGDLGGNNRSPDLFARYAKELSSPPRNPLPKNILLDLAEASQHFVTAFDGKQLEIEDVCIDCIEEPKFKNRTFELDANGKKIQVEIAYDASKKRYSLISDALDKHYKMFDTNVRAEKLTTFLNKRQSFNVVPESASAIYGHGFFFNPNIPTGDNFSPAAFPVGDILIPLDQLNGIGSEKGKKCQSGGSSWEAGCLFHFIDESKTSGKPLNKYVHRPDVLVCDDMGKEVCDFILCDKDGSADRVVMIHAKAQATRSPGSASKLQEVCAQATKNVSFLSMLSSAKPPNQSRWGDPWVAAKIKGQVTKRIRIGKYTKDTVWPKIEEKIKKPSTKREVWIVLGNTLSKRHLFADLAKADVKPETLHIVNLLKSTMAAVSSMGANLKVFCMP